MTSPVNPRPNLSIGMISISMTKKGLHVNLENNQQKWNEFSTHQKEILEVSPSVQYFGYVPQKWACQSFSCFFFKWHILLHLCIHLYFFAASQEPLFYTDIFTGKPYRKKICWLSSSYIAQPHHKGLHRLMGT